MSNNELLKEWEEAKEYFKETGEKDWNQYFYILDLQKELKKCGLDIEEI